VDRERATTSQTVGPFFSVGLRWLNRSDLAPAGVSGERVTVEGRVTDGDGQPVPDALLELWAPSFRGFGRVATDDAGRFRFTTVKAPHILVSVFARGLQRRLVTRLYFPDEPGNDSDSALSLVPPARRETLIARRGDPLRWDIALQGPAETVFFDIF
jgi:protocatechuate 3,4-dioxygenase alpha subunit